MSADGFILAGEGVRAIDNGRWRIAAAAVTGPSHRRRRAECDDAIASCAGDRWLVAAVCDGAGSAPRGGNGAALIARMVCHHLSAELALRTASKVSLRLESLLYECVNRARDELARIAAEAGLPLSAYATTLVGAALREGRGAIFHIGDGAALTLDQSGRASVASAAGAEQQYANETFFVTDAAWREHFRVRAASRVQSLLLMTDGVTPFVLDRDGPKASFIEPVRHYLGSHPADRAVIGLQRMLDRDDARGQIGDDKALLWADRCTAAA